MSIHRAVLCALLPIAVACGSGGEGGDTVAEGDDLSVSPTTCSINGAPATRYYDALVHTTTGQSSALLLHRQLTLQGQLSTKLGEKLLRMELFLLSDGTYLGGYSEGRLLSKGGGTETSLVDAAVVLKGTWKVECEKIRLSDLGVAEPFAFEYAKSETTSKEQPGIRIAMERDLISAGLKGSPRVLLREWTSSGPENIERSFTLAK